MLVYTAGPFSGENKEQNIETARKVAAELWDLGHAVICPHANTAHLEQFTRNTEYEDFLRGDLEMISVCDALVMLPGWRKSAGASEEYAHAKRLGLFIYEYPALPPKHVTEARSPNQARRFREILGRMYRTHLRKNADYSPANVLATGEVGLVTRLWDKIARLLSLYGCKFKIEGPGEWNGSKAPSCEAVEDTFLDAAVYAIIGLLLREGSWGN